MRKYIFILASLCLALCACKKIDDETIPAMPVNIDLANIGYWTTYGVSGYGSFRYFNTETREPANFPFTAHTYTGFGGVVIICGFDFTTGDYNSVLAYDMACPVERQRDVRISINQDFKAVCPKCGSQYDVCEGAGAPTSGTALSRKIGLRRYSAIARNGGYVIVNTKK